MKEYTIAITTFSKRYNFLEETLKKVREFNVESDVIICINGEKDADFNEEYRKKVLNLCSSYDRVFPIFFIELRGLSKMWNTCIIHSSTDDVLILNDDIEIHSGKIFSFTHSHIQKYGEEYKGLTKFNSTFSYFLVNKGLMDEVGYFDERLLGFGEEDGDITHRLLSMNKGVSDVFVSGLKNIVSTVRHESVARGVGKYSRFNRSFIQNQKYKASDNGIKGMFSYPCEKILEDESPYPYESFFAENKAKLFS
jgi:glycosyltransferase involved in cell wall biosynthesis